MTVAVKSGRSSSGLLSSTAPKLERVQRTHEMPLSFGQQRLWFLDQFDPGNSAYNIPFTLRLRGSLDFTALRAALDKIVRRHEILRTTFPLVDGHPVQKINNDIEVALEEVHLREIRNEKREIAAGRLLQAEAGAPFDLAKGPLLRVKLFHLAKDEWLLMVVMHHIVSDGWSGGIMVREFAQLYPAYAKGEKSPLPELEIQYADFAVWQQHWMQGEILEKQREYWMQQLAQMRLLELPADAPRSAAMSNPCASVTRQLPAGLLKELKKFALQENATLFMVLIACWQWLLSRYCGDDDVACGTPVANRNRVETEKLIGFFVNTLVLRTRVQSRETLRELLKDVRQTVLDANRHQDLPFEKLVEDLDAERELSRNPLFDVMFVMQNTPPRKLALHGLTLEEVKIEAQQTKLDLTLFAEERGEELDCRLKYNTERFQEQAMERMLEHWRIALETMVRTPEQRISEVSLLSREERQQMLVEWNRTEAQHGEACVHDLFKEQVRRSPEDVAVEFEGQRLTYRELNRRTNQLAHYLRKLGTGPEMRVGICMERSLEMVVGLLGILKAGGAYVPLDPAYPAEWLAYMLEDAAVSALITQSQLIKVLPTDRFPIVLLEDQCEQLREESGENLISTSMAGNLAYVIYTSGSTGRPKGVMVSHRAIANHLRWRQKAYPLTAADRFLHKASLSFDIAGWEIFAPLIAGAQLVICIPQGQQDSNYLAKLIAQEQITVAHFNPSMLRAFLDEPLAQSCHSLKRVFCGGDVMTTELESRFTATLPAALVNQYGPTETTVDVLVWDCHGGDRPRAIPIGRPIDNACAYILDPDLQPVPVSVPGELHIAGLPLARGYLNRPDSTAERYIPHPFSTEPGERLFKTGDLVRYRPDGNIEFMGRTDRQVKVRGYRIELEAIEAVLTGHEGVKETAVVARLGADGSQRLVAFVAGRVAAEELRMHVQSKMPEYMAPSVFVLMESLPHTPSGKIDRKRLPEPEVNSDEKDDYVGPRNGEEEILCGIFSEVLKLERIGIYSNFFALGGHSLLATQIISRVRTVFAVEMPLRVLFEAPTVAKLAGQLRGLRERNPAARLVIAKAARTDTLPLSYAQQRLWFLDQMDPGSSGYNVPVGLRLNGKVDRKAIQNSLNEIVHRHEVLRTSFAVKQGQPLQKIAPELQLPLDVIDLRSCPDEEREKEARKLTRQEAGAPFALESGPLLRIKLLQLAEEDYVLLLTMHHIVSDVWSLGVLVREFRWLYEAEVEGRKAILEDLPIQYADFAVWQREWLRGEVLEEQSGYWRRQLAEVPELTLPTDFPRPAVMSHSGASVDLRIGERLTEKLRELSRREGVTLFMSLLAGWQVMLSKYAGQADVAVGTAVANRSRVETEPLIGFFVNTLVLRTELGGDLDFRKALKRVRQVTLDAYQHQDMPFEKLVEELAPQRDLSRSPLFQVMLVMQNTGLQGLQLPEVKVSSFEIESEAAKFDLLLTLSERSGKLEGKLVYARDLFEAATIARMAGHLHFVLEKMVSEPEARVGELSLLSGEEREQVLVEWNRTGAEYREECVHELFEEQARRSAGDVAIEFEGQQLTYGELNERANQLAHYLRRIGIRPEVRVGICMERSLEMVVGLLGILKAGGTYVPLDPEYPVERLRFMIGDAAITALITQNNLVHQLHVHDVRVICLEETLAGIACESAENVDIQLSPRNLAYVIYTSGSSGTPKGVAIEHRNTSVLLRWAREVFSGEDLDGVLASTSICFDLSVFEIFAPLSWGGKTILVRNALSLAEMKPASGVKLLNTVSSAMAELLRIKGIPESVRIVNLAGEALQPGLVKQIYDELKIERLFNLYGPSEDTTYSTCAWLKRKEQGGRVSIGRPILNTQAYILDSNYQPVPLGSAGELYLSGAGVARGYLNRPALTAERFIPDPFGERRGARMYRTGDLVKWDRNGNLEFLGRLDQQVKVRGYRIELGEIETQLASHPGVKGCVVVIRQDQSGSKQIVAYVTGGTTVEDLRTYLKSKLPDYMVPSVFVRLEALPLTASGKIDRKALLSMPEVHAGSQYVAPRNNVEEQLCAIWQDVLGLKRVGVEDNFFELGGHSLLATRVISRVQEIFPVQLRLRVIFQTPTVCRLAQEIENAMKAEAVASGAEIKPSRRHPAPIAARKTFQLEQALTSMESLSEEEVQTLLDAQIHKIQ